MYIDFSIMASISDLVFYPDEQRDEYIPHPNFQAVMDVLSIHVPIEAIYERYFDHPVNTGDVLVFGREEQPGSCIVLDTYRDPLDQLDMIRFGWRTKENIEEVQRLSRLLYDECEYAVCYSEGQSVLLDVLREDKYPRKFHYVTLFEQRIKRYLV